MTTTLATAVASFVWAMAEYALRGKPSILGFCSGAVAGLVVITPACGFVTSTGAMIIGIVAGLIPFLACWKLKAWFGYDDALDTFGVHAVGGTLGALLTGFLATAAANPNLTGDAAKANGLAKLVTDGGLWLEQLKAIGVTLVLGHRRHDRHRLPRQGHRRSAVDRGSRSLGPGPGRTRRGGLPHRRAVNDFVEAMPVAPQGGGGRRGAATTSKTKTTTKQYMSTPKSVIELAKKSGAKMVDIKFVDTFGTWQHFSCPIRELTEEIFERRPGL